MQVTVVGAGVIGLTTALTLEQRGHQVRVVAAATGDATTSAVAAAVWFPYRVGPRGKVVMWAARTRRWLEELAHGAPEAGVDMLTCYELAIDRDRPWWAGEPTMEGDTLAFEALAVEHVPAPVTGSPPAWRFAAPRAQPSLLMPYLESKLHRPIERRVVTDLAAERGDVIINCTGLGARELANDALVTPLLGQVVLVEPGDADLEISVTDDRDPDRVFYAIPRRDHLVLGGCSLPYPTGAEPELQAGITDRILTQARQLGISTGRIRSERVGLRPHRGEVRLERDERDGRVIHNYGHGGAGFTLCRGCAEDVAALLG